MNLLLDTHAFLWYYSGSIELSNHAREAIEQEENNFFISMASLWEIAIKNSLGKLELNSTLDDFFKDIIEKGFNLVPIDPIHILQTASLPFLHRDPFDRLIIGQALVEKMAIITRDLHFRNYSDLQVIW